MCINACMYMHTRMRPWTYRSVYPGLWFICNCSITADGMAITYYHLHLAYACMHAMHIHTHNQVYISMNFLGTREILLHRNTHTHAVTDNIYININIQRTYPPPTHPSPHVRAPHSGGRTPKNPLIVRYMEEMRNVLDIENTQGSTPQNLEHYQEVCSMCRLHASRARSVFCMCIYV